MMKTTKVPFAENQEAKVKLHKEVEVYGSQILSKTVQKMKAHASSESPMRYLEAELHVCAKKGGSIGHQLGNVKEPKAEMPSSGCTHFLCKQHIPHTTNLINHLVSCVEKLKVCPSGSKECILHFNGCCL